MKYLIFLLSFISIELSAQTKSDPSYFPDLISTWQSENKKQHIRVSYDSITKTYIGKIVWMYEDDPSQGRKMLDSKNPNKSLQSRRVTGVNLIYNLKWVSGSKFKGMIYDPNSGKEYKCNLSLRPDRKSVEIRAYIMVPMIGRTEIATKL